MPNWLLLLAGMVAVAACTPGDTAPDPTGGPTTPPQANSSTSSPVTTSPSPPPSTVPGGNPDREWPSTGDYLVYGSGGVDLVGSDGSVTSLLSEPTLRAFALTDSVLVVQHSDDSDPPVPDHTFWVHRQSQDPMLVAISNRELRLHDVGRVEGGPAALASVINWQGQETYEELVLIDLAAEPSPDPGDALTVLGRVGQWENLVAGAYLVDDLVVYWTSHDATALTLDGAIVWRRTLDLLDSPGSFVIVDDRVVFVTPAFSQPDFEPYLDLLHLSLATGETIDHRVLELEIGFDGGFCATPAWDGTRLLCGESYGGPVAIDLDTGQVRRIADIDGGVPTVVRDR